MNAEQFNAFLDATRSSDIKLRVFSSGDSVSWLTWRQHAESIVVLKNWNRDAAARTRARWAIRSAMTDHAGRAVADLDPAAAPQPDTVGAFLDLFQARFCPAAESRIAKAAFKNAAQTDAETVLEWHVRARSLYLRANPAHAGNAEVSADLIDRFVEGLRDPAVRVYTYDSNPGTFAAALTAASNKTASGVVMAGLQGQQTRNPFTPKKEAGMFAMNVGDIECYFCRERGHFKRDCALWKKAELRLGARGGPAQRGSKRGGGRGAYRFGSSRGGAGSGGRGSSAKGFRGRSMNQMGNGEEEEGEQFEQDPENC